MKILNYKQLSPQKKQEIIVAFQKGMECRRIPCYLGVSERSVARVLKEAGVNTKRRNRYTLNESYFDQIDSPIKAYLLGLLAADGCVTATNYVAFESIDQELTQLLKTELEYTGNIRMIQPKDYNPHYRINFSSQRIARALYNSGVQSGRTFSGVYYFPANEYLGAYILGYFDGDGCAYVNLGRSGGVVGIVGSFEFTCELAKLLSMGSIFQHSLKKVYYWRIFSHKNIQDFYNIIYQYSSLGLKRKKLKVEQILRSYKRG